MVKVKICGITNIADARAAVDAGADAIGFVFYKKSKRYIHPAQAKIISAQLPKRIKKVGVFVNENVKAIRSIVLACKLDFIQLHGAESPDLCKRLRQGRVIKAFPIKDKLPLNTIRRYNCYAYLFDAFDQSQKGGTGKCFDWKLLSKACDIKSRVFLSGGLNARNVSKAIKVVRPAWIDVSSSLEKKPGIKDHRKIKTFMRKVKSATTNI